MQIRAAFLGLSDHAEEYLLPSIQSSPHFELACVVSRNLSKARRFQRRFGVLRIATDWRNVLSSGEFDAVLVSGPPLFHEEVATACLMANLPVFVEKPCARSLTSMRKLADCAIENPGTPTFVGYNFRHADSYSELIRLARHLGGIRDLTIRFQTNKPTKPLWDYTTIFESYMYAIAIHPIEMALSLIGLPTSISITYMQASHTTFEMVVTMLGAKGTRATLHLGNCVARFFLGYSILTESGHTLRLSPTSLTGVHVEPEIELGPTFASDQSHAENRRTDVYSRDYGYLQELESFAEAIAGRRSTTSPIQNSLPVYEVIQAILSDSSCPVPYAGD